MATIVQSSTASVQPQRLSVLRYMALDQAGVFGEERSFELLDGLLVERMTTYAPHAFTVIQTGQLLREILAANWLIREEKPVQLDLGWLPQPDIAVVEGPNRRYAANTPVAADVAFLVEVSDSTYASDRGKKWQKYAMVGIPTYWIINLDKRRVEVYRQPTGTGADAIYAVAEVFGEADTVPVVINGREVGRIGVVDLLP